MKETAICIEKVTRYFGTIRALDELSLSVPQGTIFGFLGPNGAGKTTTIHLLLGLLEPTSGVIEVMGFDTRKKASIIRSQTGALLEHNGLYEQLTVKDNLDFYGRVWQLNENDRQVRIKELLKEMDLWERKDEKVFNLSKGMKQKLALARALMHRPELVILDEPTAGLDVVAAAALRKGLKSLASKEGITIFMATHNMTEAENLCDSVAVIRQGKLLAIGSPAELRTKSDSSHVEIIGSGLDNIINDSIAANHRMKIIDQADGRLVLQFDQEVEVSPIISILASHGAKVEEVNKEKASLESVFLTLMDEENE